MRVVIVASGSMGDIEPFVVVGKYLVDKKIEVTAISNKCFEKNFKQSGMQFVAMEALEEGTEIYSIEQKGRRRGLSEDINHRITMVNDLFVKPIKGVYNYIIENFSAQDTLIINHFLTFGGKLASEVKGIPILTLLLAPHWLQNSYDLVFMKVINEVRAGLGLSPLKEVMASWMLENNVLGIYPKCFDNLQKVDTNKAHIKQLGFIYKHPMVTLDEVAQEDQKPIAFRLSSAAASAKEEEVEHFFNCAQKVCKKLNRKAIFLTNGDKLPIEVNSEYVTCYDYIPFEEIFPKVSIVVHDGGIGTCSEALRAGAMQLICPRSDEQHSNGKSLIKNGLGEVLLWKRLNEERLEEKLMSLLNSDIPMKCKEYAKKEKTTEEVLEEIYQEISTLMEVQNG